MWFHNKTTKFWPRLRFSFSNTMFSVLQQSSWEIAYSLSFSISILVSVAFFFLLIRNHYIFFLHVALYVTVWCILERNNYNISFFAFKLDPIVMLIDNSICLSRIFSSTPYYDVGAVRPYCQSSCKGCA